MLNSLTPLGPPKGTLGVYNIASMIRGHHLFLQRNTGVTVDPEVQHFVLNPQGVLANNRHFIAKTQQEAQPNGDATTEGQSLLILGYAHAYIATKNPEYLAAATKAWDAYVAYFYVGQAIPNTPSRWICNWIVNGKEPVLANWPVNATEPTHSGFKGSMITFTNGRTVIPHGAPHWGEYLDKATFAFEGHLTWDAINANVVKEVAGEIIWGEPGVTYPVDWIIAGTGQKIDWDGNLISSGHTLAEMGTVQLKNTALTGTYKFNYANRQPVDKGGYLIKTNEVQHNRPLHVPLPGTVNQMGNASDAEEWFADACYVMWKITGDIKYKKAFDCVLFTLSEYADIDALDKFFRKAKDADTPFTDGISYDYVYPSDTVITYGRDVDGYITVASNKASQLTLEQQAINFRVSKDSIIRTTFGGKGSGTTALTGKVEVLVKPLKESPDSEMVTWNSTFAASSSMTPVVQDIPLSGFVRSTDASGNPYITADMRAASGYGGAVVSSVYDNTILGNRTGSVIKVTFPDDDAGMSYDYDLLPGGRAPATSITYKADAPFDFRIVDDNGWRWYWILPQTAGVWSTFTLNKANMVLSGYQPNHPSDPSPSAPVFTTIDSFTIILENADLNKNFFLYCLNTPPAVYTATDGFVIMYRLNITGTEAYQAKVGDCTVINYLQGSLAYTPGLIPFSNIYNEGSSQIGAWHGMPYPGYQYPFIYCHNPIYDGHMTRMIDFLLDSQKWYTTKFGIVGPGASAYIWNRWDNAKYGPPDTFTMYHFGDQHAWSGYQPRAMMGACRAWYELQYQGKTVPTKLKTYSENWIKWLISYMNVYKMAPTEFPSEAIPIPLEDDFTGHMSGLWLSGACLAAMSGCTIPGLDKLIEDLFKEIQDNYKVTNLPGNAMNGSWSPALRLGTDNGMFFGFWAGEIMRGLGLYTTYRLKGVGADIYSLK